MILPRIIPVLLVKGSGIYKGEKFRNHKYVGDPLNITNIFNAKNVDELLVIDISATDEGRCVSPRLVEHLSDQCLMPFAVGGGIRSANQVKELLAAGAEKVCIGTAAFEIPGLISDLSGCFGSQSVLVSVDYKSDWLGRERVFVQSGKKSTGMDVLSYVKKFQSEGAGEILLNSIERDGQRSGMDIEQLKSLLPHVTVPVILGTGAGSSQDLKNAIEAKADAVAAGSMFIYHGSRKAVLVSYPDELQLIKIRGD